MDSCGLILPSTEARSLRPTADFGMLLQIAVSGCVFEPAGRAVNEAAGVSQWRSAAGIVYKTVTEPSLTCPRCFFLSTEDTCTPSCLDTVTAIVLVRQGGYDPAAPAPVLTLLSEHDTLSFHFTHVADNVWLMKGLDIGDLSGIALRFVFVNCGRFKLDTGATPEAPATLVVYGAYTDILARSILADDASKLWQTIAGKLSHRILPAHLAACVNADGTQAVRYAPLVVTNIDAPLQFPEVSDCVQYPDSLPPFTLLFDKFPRLFVKPELTRCIKAGVFGAFDASTGTCTLYLGRIDFTSITSVSTQPATHCECSRNTIE